MSAIPPHGPRQSQEKLRDKLLMNIFREALMAIKKNEPDTFAQCFAPLKPNDIRDILYFLDMDEFFGVSRHTLLLHACYMGDSHIKIIEHILNLLDQLKDPSFKKDSLEEENGAKHTPLIIAIARAQTKTIATLIQHGANIHACNYGVTSKPSALMTAAMLGKIESMSVLLKYGARINEIDHEGTTALHHAVRSNHTKGDNLATIKFLLSRKADLHLKFEKGSFIHLVAAHSSPEVGKLLLEQGANIEEQTRDGDKPVHLAVLNKNKGNFLQFLIEQGATLDSPTFAGWLPIHSAAFESFDALKCLVELGKCDVNAQNPYTLDTPLINASMRGQTDIIDYLASKKADPNIQNIVGSNALSTATSHRKLGSVKRLLSIPGINVCTPFKFRALSDEGIKQAAIQYFGNPKKLPSYQEVHALLEKPEHYKIKHELFQQDYISEFDMTHLYHAVHSAQNDESIKIVTFLLHAHQKQSLKDTREMMVGPIGITLLFTAVRKGQLKVLQNLITVGGDPRAQIPSKTAQQDKTIQQSLDFVLNLFAQIPGCTLLMQIASQIVYLKKNDRYLRKKAEYLEMVKYLVEQSKAKHMLEEHVRWINAISDKGQSALNFALGDQDVELLQLLIKEGAHIDLIHLQISQELPAYNQKISLLLENFILKRLAFNQELTSCVRYLVEHLLGKFIATNNGLEIFFSHHFPSVTVPYDALPKIILELQSLLKNSLEKPTQKQFREAIFKDSLGTHGKKEDAQTVQKSLDFLEEFDLFMLKIRNEIETTKNKLRSITIQYGVIVLKITRNLNTIEINLPFLSLRPDQKKSLFEYCQPTKNEVEQRQNILTNKLTNIMARMNDSRILEERNTILHSSESERAKKLEDFKTKMQEFIEECGKLIEDIAESQKHLKEIIEPGSIKQVSIVNAALTQQVKDNAPKTTTRKQHKKKGGVKNKGKSSTDAPTVTQENITSGKNSNTLNKEQDPKINHDIPNILTERLKELQMRFVEYEMHETKIQRELEEELKTSKDSLREKNAHSKITFREMAVHDQNDSNSLDSVGQISNKFDISLQKNTLQDNLELMPLPGLLDTVIIWSLSGSLAQLMESLKNLHGGIFPRNIANHIRDILYYRSDNFPALSSQVHLEKTIKLIIAFLDHPKNAGKKFKDIQEFLRILEGDLTVPKLNTSLDLKDLHDTATHSAQDQSLLQQLLHAKPLSITPQRCQAMIFRGMKNFMTCRTIFESGLINDDASRLHFRNALGFICGLIGNFSSHLRRDFKENAEAQKIYASLKHSTSKKMLAIPDLTLERCIEIGRNFRHLNKKRQGTELVSVQETWEKSIETIMAQMDSLKITKKEEADKPKVSM